MPSCALHACKQWRRSAARSSACATLLPRAREWAAALTRLRSGDVGRRRLDAMMLKARLHTHRLPDIAIVLSTNPMNAGLLDKVATASSAHPDPRHQGLGLIGPLIAHETSEHADRQGSWPRRRTSRRTACCSGASAGASRALAYQLAGKRRIVTHGARRHGARGGPAWRRAPTPKVTYPGPLCITSNN